MSLRKYSLLLAMLLLGTAMLWAIPGNAPRPHDPWMISFGAIASDSTHAYFVSDRWVGYYLAVQRLMFMTPRDSIKVPRTVSGTDSVMIGSTTYTAKRGGLVRQEPRHKPRTLKLPKLRADLLMNLWGTEFKAKARRKAVQRTIHRLTSHGDRIWFGIQLTDTTTGNAVTGIGWRDLKRKRFGEVFDSSLTGCVPIWIGVAADTVNVLCTRADSAPSAPRLMRYALTGGTWSSLSPSSLALANEAIQSAAVWGDTLLLTTDTHIIIWRPHEQPEIWSTWMYAAPKSAPLYMVNFAADTGGSGPDTLRIRILGAGQPVEVRFWHGDYAEITTEDDVLASIDDADWRAHQRLWSENHWNCGDSLCFADVHLLRSGRFREAQVIHVPISYAGKDENGIRVRFQAAWVRRSDLLPILLPR